ncbi:MAG: hypothetical protein CM1200mP13_16190 [Candidatus Pelagibacterales bacterium]|nr:MAG: hypothetical protein CM1200mP13_16190 [Pelagibacterales bacterium]
MEKMKDKSIYGRKNKVISENIKINILDQWFIHIGNILTIILIVNLSTWSRSTSYVKTNYGDENFKKFQKEFLTNFRYGNPTTNDLIRSVNDATSSDMNWFFDQWVLSAGHPRFRFI